MRYRAFFLVFAVSLITVVLTACGGDDQPTPTPAEQSVEVGLRNFVFEPSEFDFAVGEEVQFRLRSRDIEHTFTVRDLDIDWFVRPGGSTTESFTFDQPGEYRLICSIVGHEAAGMVGVIRVE